MASEIQIEAGEEVKIGAVRVRNTTGNAIRISVDDSQITLNVVACCIGE